MLMTAKVRGEERMRKAGRDRQTAEARRAPAGTVRNRLSLARRALAEAAGRYDDPTEK